VQGNKDDITVWVDLPQVQKWLELPERITMIQALECNCKTVDRLAEIEQEVSGMLGGDVQVVELSGIAIARAKARNEVEASGKAAEARTASLAVRLFPLAIIAAGAVTWMLALANVRERRSEIGILRAIGVQSGQILAVFLSKALMIGVLGGLIGFGLGFLIASYVDRGLEDVLPEAAAVQVTAQQLFQPMTLVSVLLLTPLLAVMASWLPALSAATQDPAMVLREE
jgi:predicted lysophospholipase L1 biosynthesis ABC-type transport system permease subunit